MGEEKKNKAYKVDTLFLPRRFPSAHPFRSPLHILSTLTLGVHLLYSNLRSVMTFQVCYRIFG